MSFTEGSFLIGPVAGPVLAAGSCVVVVVTTRRPRVVFSVAGLSFVVFVSFVAHWFFWGKGFESAESGLEVPAGVDLAMNVAMGVCAGAATAVTVFAVLVAVFSGGRDGDGVPPRPAYSSQSSSSQSSGDPAGPVW